MRRLAAFVLVALVAGCTGPDRGGPEGLLAVIGDDGNLAVMEPDGSGRVAVTTDAGSERTYRQPAWSPDGRHLAFVEITGDPTPGLFALAAFQPEPTWQVRVAGRDGAPVASLATPFAPFYLAWSPDGERLAMLGNDGDTIGLAVARVGEEAATLLDRGAPYYLSWAPDSDRLLTHVGTDRLDILDLDGSATSLGAAPGRFRAPAWIGGDRMAYVEGSTDGADLVVTDGTDATTVAPLSGFAAFVPSPDGRRVAYVDSVVSGGATFGPLFVTGNGGPQHVTTEPVVAFSWSLDGAALLYLLHEAGAAGAWLRWGVWDGEAATPYGRFRPSPVFASEYLPFFDQYAQSLSFWAPDGSAFVYAGEHEEGGAGVWVQQVGTNTGPTRVAAGVFAAWSP